MVKTSFLFVALSMCASFGSGLHVKTSPKLFSVRPTQNVLFRRSTAIMLIDPVAVDTMTNTAEIATNTFFTSFVARAVGALVGNLLAALAFKFASDTIFKKNEPEKVAVVAPAPAPEISQSAWIKLLFCIMIDLGSDASFLLPGIGEMEDLAWAPVSAYLLNLLFGSGVVSSLEFAKEILPGTDILPLATLAWVLQNVFVDSPITSALGLKKKVGQIAAETEIKVVKESLSPEMDAWDNKMNKKI